MKIFPIISGFLISSLGFFPMLANLNGWGMSSTPLPVNKTVSKCQDNVKDSYGRCPYTGSSNFRYISLGGSGGSSGGSRSGSGSGGK